MAVPPLHGLAPFVPDHRPSGAPRWWVATAPSGLAPRARRLAIVALEERAEPPEIAGIAGVAAPLSLPPAFLEALGLPADRRAQLAALAARTPRRLRAEARTFAARRPRGARHPLRGPGESLSALDRARLPLFHAALPLLSRIRTVPWDEALPPFLVEVDVPSFLGALGLPASGLAGGGSEAIRRRIRVVEALEGDVIGFGVQLSDREVAVAALHALRAVVAAVAAAWFFRNRPDPPPAPAACWIPLPA
jgi:hypothetical protein